MCAFREVFTKRFLRAVTGEFLGTLFLVLIGLNSTKWAGTEEGTKSSTILMISLCFGLSITTMVYCFGHVSGAHINPAVTVALVFSRKFNLDKAFFYIVSQCLGAAAGSAIVYVAVPKTENKTFGVTLLSSDISLIQGIMVELLITFQLVFTVFTTCDPKNSDLKGSAALAIGFSVTIGHLFAVPYTGASMNPARSLGPAFINWNWEHHWVYWLGPIAGGVLAAIMYKYLCQPSLNLKQCVMNSFSKEPSKKFEDQIESFPVLEKSDMERDEKNPGFLESLWAFARDRAGDGKPKPFNNIEEKMETAEP
ncbi:hypothetical protein JZ751_017727, partial [Albula glossodonta]